MPSLDAATMTLRFFNPRSTWPSLPYLLCILPQIGIVFIDPILARRIEDVQVYRVLERDRLVRHMGRNAQHFPGRDSDFPVVDEEMQCAFKNVRDLLIVMTVQWHLAPFLSRTRATITLVPTTICRPISGFRFSTSMSFHLVCFAVATVSAMSFPLQKLPQIAGSIQGVALRRHF